MTAAAPWAYRRRALGAGIFGGVLSSGGSAATALTYIAAVEAAGGVINAAGKTAYNNLVGALDTAGVWSRIDRLWCWRAQDSIAALRDLKTVALATAVAAPTFIAKDGYDFNGTTQYINTGFNPATAGGGYAVTSAHVMVWTLDNFTGGSQLDVAVSDATHCIRVNTGSTGPALAARLNTVIAGAASLGTVAASSGHSVVSRTASNVTNGYKDGVALSLPQATLGQSLPNALLYAGAENINGTPGSFSTRKQAMLSIGAGLSAAQATALYNACNAFMAAMAAS